MVGKLHVYNKKKGQKGEKVKCLVVFGLTDPPMGTRAKRGGNRNRRGLASVGSRGGERRVDAGNQTDVGTPRVEIGTELIPRWDDWGVVVRSDWFSAGWATVGEVEPSIDARSVIDVRTRKLAHGRPARGIFQAHRARFPARKPRVFRRRVLFQIIRVQTSSLRLSRQARERRGAETV